MTRPVSMGGLSIGKGGFAVIAGPCSIESRAQILETAEFVSQQGAVGLRGGIFKLRTRPQSFQGLGDEALELAKEAKEKVGLPFVSEITDPRQIEKLLDVVDIFQVGARNMHNYELLKELGHTSKPVLLKRNFCAFVEEWIAAAEYIAQKGNARVILCERGIRTFETITRNTLDLNAVAYVKKKTSLPVLVDPSHGTGNRDLVEPLSLAAAAVGADGLLLEVHPDPKKALSDGFQSLSFQEFQRLMVRLEALLKGLGRNFSTDHLKPEPSSPKTEMKNRPSL